MLAEQSQQQPFPQRLNLVAPLLLVGTCFPHPVASSSTMAVAQPAGSRKAGKHGMLRLLLGTRVASSSRGKCGHSCCLHSTEPGHFAPGHPCSPSTLHGAGFRCQHLQTSCGWLFLRAQLSRANSPSAGLNLLGKGYSGNRGPEQTSQMNGSKSRARLSRHPGK